MEPALRLKTTVLPGNRVEFIAPELPEGAEVEILVALAPRTRTRSVLEIVDARPPSRLTDADWRQIEGELQEDRDSWDR